MSTADEILLMTEQAARRLQQHTHDFRREAMPSLFGMTVRVAPDHMQDLFTVPHWKVEKLPIRKRRKAYRVVCERRPCAFIVNERYSRLPEFNGWMDL